MEYIQVSAKTVDDAVLEAAMKLATTREHLEYEVIDKGSSGFLGFGGRDAVIKARALTEEEINKVDDSVKEAEEPIKEVKKEFKKEFRKSKPAEAPVKEEKTEKPAEPVKKEVTGKKISAEEFLNDVFKAMDMVVNVQVTENKEEHTMDIELSGEEMGVLIGKRGQTLDSLQYLVSLVVNKYSDEYIRVKIDTENYRERRKETLENLARNIAYKVKRTRKTVALEPMNPYERRVIHSALQNDRYVTTHSEGEEPYRRVVVTLKDNHYRNHNNNHRRGER